MALLISLIRAVSASVIRAIRSASAAASILVRSALASASIFVCLAGLLHQSASQKILLQILRSLIVFPFRNRDQRFFIPASCN